ncbi:MAG: peptidyl-prolyl cis-trans isomerase, partial [Holophagales bacterium]|nr:peptidyl-prolyl cis-trans isomerase [Holophagales bacterium]
GVVITFIVALFFDFGTVDLGPQSDQVAATVGTEKITYADYRSAYRDLENRYRQMFGEQWSSEMAQQFNLQKQALDQLVTQRILLMEAGRMGLSVTDEEARREIVNIPALQDENGVFVGRDEVQRRLQASRMSEAEFARNIKEVALLQKLTSVLGSTLYISDEQLVEAYRDEKEQAKIRFVQLPASEMAGQVTVSDDEMLAYFADHATEYEKPEQRVMDYLLVDTVKLRQELEIPDEELQAYWQTHQDEFMREEQIRARHILLRTGPDRDEETAKADIEALKERIAAGEDFASLAREMSEDASNAEKGGNLGFFGRGNMVKPFEDAVFGSEVGDLVGPIVTSYGVHLAEVQEKRAGGVQPFEQAKSVIRARMIGTQVDELAQDKASEIAKRIRDENLAGSEQLAALAEEEGSTFETSKPFGKDDPLVGLGRVAELNEAVFGLEPGGMTEPVKVPRGWVIAHLSEVFEPRIPELSEVESEVRRKVEAQKQKEAAVGRLGEMRARLGDELDFQGLADELGLEAQESNSFNRNGSIATLGRLPAVLDAALTMEVGEVSEPIAGGQGAVLFEVIERTQFDASAFEEEKHEFHQQQKDQKVDLLLQSIVEKRRRDLVPKYDARLVEEFGLG